MRRIAPMLILSIALLGGCSAGPDVVAPTAAPASPSPSSPPMAVEEETEGGVPVECEEASSTSGADADGGAIAAASENAVIPETVSRQIGTQVISSVDQPGMYEAVVRVCSEPLAREQLVEIANAVALAIYSDPSHETLALLKVSSWVPDGAGSVAQDYSLTTESYQDYLWDNTTGAIDAAWK